MTDTLLETQALTRSFGGFVAVRDVSLRIRKGSIHALIGPNGAGKTTCFNLLTKFLSPSSGTIHFDGLDITGLSPSEVALKGIVRSFQISSVFPQLTALENVRLALQRRRGKSYDFWRSKSVLSDLENRARELLRDVGIETDIDTIAARLPYGRKRALEIATTLAVDPKLMLLDEPTAGMAQADVDRIVKLIDSLRQGRTILMVEHNLSVVEGLCERITVLARGSVLAEGDYRTIANNPKVIEAYLGSADD